MHSIAPKDTHALILEKEKRKEEHLSKQKNKNLNFLFRDVLGVLLNFLSPRYINDLAQLNHWFNENIFAHSSATRLSVSLDPFCKTAPLFPLVLRQQIEAHQFIKPMNYIECKRLLNAYTHYKMRPFFPMIYHLRLEENLVVIEDAELRTLIGCFPNLLTLNIASKSVTNTGLEVLSTCTTLKKLDLTACTEIGNEGLKHLSGLHHLETLNLIGCGKITDAGLQNLQEMKQLKHLSLAWCKEITDVGLRVISQLTSLQNLDCSWCEKIKDKGVATLSHLVDLRFLDLSHCARVTDKGILQLKNLPLHTLSTDGCTLITPAGLSKLNLASEARVMQDV